MEAAERRIAQLEAQVRQLTFRVDQIPRPVASPISTLFRAGSIWRGTQFYKPSGAASGVYGLKYKTGLATRTTVPDAVGSSDYADTYDGLASATIFKPGNIAEDVWIICGPCMDVNSRGYAAVPISAPNNHPIILWNDPIIMATEGGGRANVYRVYGL